MKCPKCSYLGFDDLERCRNCGYDFSLIPTASLPELEIRKDDADINPLDDLALVDAAAEFEPVPAPGPTPGLSKLPLFNGTSSDDLPLITKASPPRAPLAVRRATPEVPRTRSDTPRSTMLDLSDAAFRSERRFPAAARPRPAGWDDSDGEGAAVAGVFSRAGAAIIDLAVLAATDFIVVYFTMQICGLSLADFDVLPKGPLIAFLLVQNGGYLVAFTAGGQTLGKMAMGIRVISTRETEHVDMAHSLLRTALWVLLAIPAGLGFVTALFSRERRGLHDHFAGTRVIKGVG
jgi:uncharacterized RDD family membrane protein YckC